MKCIDLSLRLGYSALGCQCRLNEGGTLFRRTRYQQGSLVLEERKRGSAVWVYRWWEKDINGKPVRRKLQIGSLGQYPTESVAQAAADALRLTINNPSNRRNLRPTTVNILWEHYCREEALVLSSDEVKLGLTKLGFRDQLLVFLDGALGTRRGELGALRWSDCNFDGMSFSVQHSYYWRRGGHLKATKTEASAKVLPMHLALKDALLEWKSQTEYKGPGDFVFPSLRCKGKKPLDLAAVLKKKIQPAFASVGILGVGWHTFRHTVGTMLADMGEHQLTIRDYLRHSNLHVTNKYLQATPESKRSAQGKLVDANLPGGLLSASKSTLVQ